METTLTPQHAGEVLDRALWFAAQPSDAYAKRRRHGIPDDGAVVLAQVTALELGARLAEAAEDPRLLPKVVQALHAWTPLSRRSDLRDPLGEVFAETIAVLVRQGAEISPAVLALAHHPSRVIRRRLAGLLEQDPAAHQAVLERLAADPDPYVRDAARPVLAKVATPAWWAGVFPRDPVPLLGEDEARALGPTLARWAEVRNKPRHDGARDAELAALLAELPDVLAREVIPGLVAEGGASMTALVRRLVGLEGWPALVPRVLAVTKEGYADALFCDAFKALPEARDATAARALLAAAREYPPAAREGWRSVPSRLTRIAQNVWPPGADATAELEALFADETWKDRSSMDPVSSTILAWAQACPACRARWRDPLIEGWLGGEQDRRWFPLRALFTAARDELGPAERRALARRAIGSASEEARIWGAEQLLGPAHDPEVDPPVAAVLETFLADPLSRRAVGSSGTVIKAHAERFLDLLRSGDLEVEQATEVVNHLAGRGRTMAWPYWRRTEPAPGDAGLIGPDEWAAWRRVRDASHPEERDWLTLVFAIPLGPLCPEDRAFVMRALEVARRPDHHEARWARQGVAVALSVGGTAEDLPILDELVRLDPDLDERREHLVARLGLKARVTAARGGDEWMDREDA